MDGASEAFLCFFRPVTAMEPPHGKKQEVGFYAASGQAEPQILQFVRHRS
jgi:hypothetical protein